jgi:hypothetical protein
MVSTEEPGTYTFKIVTYWEGYVEGLKLLSPTITITIYCADNYTMYEIWADEPDKV